MMDMAMMTGVALGAVIRVAGEWKILEKMGEEGWKALIPFVSEHKIFKHTWNTKMFWATMGTSLVGATALELAKDAAGFSLALAVGLTAGTAAAVLGVKAAHKVAKAFGHGIGYTAGLLLAHPLFNLILGFGKSKFAEA